MTGLGYPAPPVRRIRVYAFDPQASTRLDSAAINIATIKLPWEQSWEEQLSPGPVNDYLEVIDVDPVSGQFYEPVDLNNCHLLAQDGLAPSEGDPRFHQQMVFAVAMKTIRTFERALGRRVLWAPRWIPPAERKDKDDVYRPVDKLRIYPHALREPNAYYSREKKALLFGYFQASTDQVGARWVFAALSHDIIVHEVTHAILDGLHRRFAEATSIDSLAFHEAFADIVALFSHFTIEEAVRAEIAKQGGRLDSRSLLSGLARQFGTATGRDGSLREAIDNHEGEAPIVLSDDLTEPHERGAVLVAAVFDGFLAIYEKRTADLLRIAGVKAGGLPQDLHPDLVSRLTREAAKAADQIMRMCIGFFTAEDQDQQEKDPMHPKEGDFRFRGGVTLIFDLREGHLRYAIKKRISDDGRLARQRGFLTKTRLGIAAQAFAAASSERSPNDEPFAFVHRGC